MTQPRVENTRVHFGANSLVSVNANSIYTNFECPYSERKAQLLVIKNLTLSLLKK